MGLRVCEHRVLTRRGELRGRDRRHDGEVGLLVPVGTVVRLWGRRLGFFLRTAVSRRNVQRLLSLVRLHLPLELLFLAVLSIAATAHVYDATEYAHHEA